MDLDYSKQFVFMAETENLIGFALLNILQNKEAIDMLTSNTHIVHHRIQPLGHWITFYVDMDKVDGISKFQILEKYAFTKKERERLVRIRVDRKGRPRKNQSGKERSGKIQTDFEFGNLYEWLKDGRTRSSKKISNRCSRSLVRLRQERDDLKRERKKLAREVDNYKVICNNQ